MKWYIKKFSRCSSLLKRHVIILFLSKTFAKLLWNLINNTKHMEIAAIIESKHTFDYIALEVKLLIFLDN